MPLYNNPALPGVNVAINPTVTSTLPEVGAFNQIYYVTEFDSLPPLLKPGVVNPIPNLESYKQILGGTTFTTNEDFRDYLTVATVFANKAVNTVVNVIPVITPPFFYQLTVATAPTVGRFSYQFSVNGVQFRGRFTIPAGTDTQRSNYALDQIAEEIKNNPLARSLFYVDGPAYNWTLNLLPTSPTQILTVSFPQSASEYLDQSPTESYALASNGWAVDQVDWTSTEVEPRQYVRAIYSALNQDSPLGVILTPRMYWSNLTGNYFPNAPTFGTKSAREEIDQFCAQTDHVYVTDVPDVDLTLASNKVYPIDPTTPYTVFSNLIRGATEVGIFEGSLYRRVNPIPAVPLYNPETSTATIPYGQLRLLPYKVTINGVQSDLILAIGSTAVAFPPQASFTSSNVGLNFKCLSYDYWINKYLLTGDLEVKDLSSASEFNLYRLRENFASRAGNTVIVAPYQAFSGPEQENTSATVWIPASAYVAALWTKVVNDVSPRVPPASNLYPLSRTAGGYFKVSDGSHAILNGQGINMIKPINNIQYVMGARTAAVDDNYIWMNARLILSILTRSVRAALDRGVTLQPTDTTNAFLSTVKSRISAVVDLFAQQGLLTEPVITCDGSINPRAQVSAGLIKAEITYTQISTGERISVMISPTLAGGINS